MRRLLAPVVFLLASLAVPALAQTEAPIETAFNAAMRTFETALPRLAAEESGVDVAAYRDALSFGVFRSSYWGGEVTLQTVAREGATGSCSRFAAFVRMPPENGVIELVLCPQFFSAGADALRELTILHELVHVVAGPDECRAMAFTARVQQAATGAYTPVDRYWRDNGCAGSRFSLP